jgi:hypothetical protein
VYGCDDRRIHALKAHNGAVQGGRPALDIVSQVVQVRDEGADIPAVAEGLALGCQQHAPDAPIL